MLEEISLAALKVEIRTLCENVSRLSTVVEQNTAQLSKLAVLEEKHNNQSAALDRAFASVRKIEDAMDQHAKDDVVIHAEIAKHTVEVAEGNAKEHKAYDKYIYLCIGFIMAVSVFWTLFGVRINNAVEGVVATSTEMQIYMRTHKGATP
jgi:hypothetical protein